MPGPVPPRLVRGLERALWAATDTLFASGLGGPMLRQRSGRRILIYHGIDRRGRLDLNARFLSRDRLAEQLAWLATTCRVVSLAEYFAGTDADDRLTVALTFDDGYANNLEHALPVLERYGLPATVFVTAGPLAGGDILWPHLVDLATTAVDEPLTIAGEIWTRHPRTGQLVSTVRGDALKSRCKADASLIPAVRSALAPRTRCCRRRRRQSRARSPPAVTGPSTTTRASPTTSSSRSPASASG